jgi:hypothetical protein
VAKMDLLLVVDGDIICISCGFFVSPDECRDVGHKTPPSKSLPTHH